ncbi:hypothetical protein MPPM_2859 [Methylorubrum populi]|uniref:TnsA endonuclease N-terminal domain-containing protein n=1 Tax=Methylorubrum populi TaxID=223967 RepID=A0A160PFL7_9HYPH|nr:hypothetical protein [Methylorubrum populi]BAU91464.1 hypothetical protein MPPM_2859 [Methylorubrum populi]
MHRIWSHRMQGDVPYESLLEADLVTILCVDPEVDGFWAQPEAFRWRQDGKVRRYVPDFLILTTAGARAYREVKPLRRLRKDPSLGGRRPAIEAESARRGATFETWTEKEIRRSPRLENAREILCHAGPVWDEPALAALRRTIRAGTCAGTTGELLRSAGLGPDALGTLLGLVALDELRIDLDQPLSLRSRLVGRRTA